MKEYSGILLYAYFRVTLAGLIVFYWFLILFVNKTFTKSFSVFSILGNAFNWLIVKILRFRWFKDFQDISNTYFEFPIRIKTAATISFVLVLITVLAVINN
jgi:hypothetical protein